MGGDGTINEVANGFFYMKVKNKSALDPLKFNPEPELNQINPKGVISIVPSWQSECVCSFTWDSKSRHRIIQTYTKDEKAQDRRDRRDCNG